MRLLPPRPWRFLLVVALCLAAQPTLAASGGSDGEEVYLAPEDFLAETFPDAVPGPQVLWLGDQLQERSRGILHHAYPALRVRYWRQGERTAWILEEVGKERPITTGIVVDGGRIERVQVLIYRESRGFEVRYPAFTRQFEGARLREGREAEALDQRIDGISGATLSVSALKRLAALALVFHRSVTDG